MRQLIGGWQNVRVIDDARFMESKNASEVLSRTAAIAIGNDNGDGIFQVYSYGNGKINGIAGVNLETLNNYPNIKEIRLLGSAKWASGLNLANLMHVERFYGEGISIRTEGIITFGPGIKEIHLKNSVFANGIDCSKCPKLESVTIDACEDLSDVASGGAAHPTGEITLPENVKIKINITGNWRTKRVLKHTQECYNRPNVEVVNDATVSTDYDEWFRSMRTLPGSVYAKACNMLGITVEAANDKTKVSAAYKRLIMQWHPDKNPGKIEEAQAKTQELNNARDVIFATNGQ
jgi:hypothetical protein